MRTAAGPGIRLDDLLLRGITLQWPEAVALVQATCRQLVVTAASGFPSTSQIMLYEEGAAVALATVDQPQVRAAARLLASVLTADVPAQLRLLVSRAGGAGSPCANLDDFAVALAYLQRRDPPALLRALYRRAAAVPAPAGMAMAPLASRLAVPRMGRVWMVSMWYLGTRFSAMSALSRVSRTPQEEKPLTSTLPAAAKR